MKPHTRCLTKRVEKKNGTNKKEGKHAGVWTLDFVLWGNAIYFWTAHFLTWNILDWCLSIRRIYTWEILTKNENSTPPRETTRARPDRPRQIRERRTWWGTSSKHYTEWRTSSRCRAWRLKTWSKSDFSIAETTWPTHLYIFIFIRVDPHYSSNSQYHLLMVAAW